jgi:hypothetical protein
LYTTSFLEIENSYLLRDETIDRNLHFRILPTSPQSLVLFRVLLGGVHIRKVGGESINQRANYFCVGTPNISGYSLHSELSRAFPNLGMQDRAGSFLPVTLLKPLEDFFKAAGTRKGFFDVLLNELTRALIADEKGNHLSAFVYIYRAIEHMSYALPFFHARHSRDYIKAFYDLRTLIAGGDGELKFCGKFIRSLFSTDPILNTHVYNVSYPPQYLPLYPKYLKGNHTKLCTATIQGANVKFLDSFDFLVDIRNKFFHHLSGSNQSASSREIPDADIFFRPLNKMALSVIALVLGKIIASEL